MKISNNTYFVDQISSTKANQFTCQYHYSHVGFKKAQINLGVFNSENNQLVGVLQWGISAQESIRLDRYVKEPITKEEYLELNRFCMADSEGKNSESQAISLGIKWLKINRPDIRLLVSYAGRKEGNYGYIYQATNWEYLGYFVSKGFWLLDGEEKHLLTLYYLYQKNRDLGLSFNDTICALYHDVRETWTKQFIYIQRLDKNLIPASEILPYPKPDNEFPIKLKEKVHKEDSNFSIPIDKEIKDKEIFFYEENEQLFTRRTLIKKGEILGRNDMLILKYDIAGNFETTYDKAQDVKQDGFSNFKLAEAQTNNKYCLKHHYFRIIDKNNDEIPLEIDVPYLCIINNIKYYTSKEVEEEFSISKQAVQQAKARIAKKICGNPVIWSEDLAK